MICTSLMIMDRSWRIMQQESSEFNKRLFEEAVGSIRTIAASHLWQLVVVRADLNGHLKAIKDYFLLAKGDFFQRKVRMSCFNCCGEDDMHKSYDNGPFVMNNAAGDVQFGIQLGFESDGGREFTDFIQFPLIRSHAANQAFSSCWMEYESVFHGKSHIGR